MTSQQTEPTTPPEPGIAQGTYEVIRDRLVNHGRTVAGRADALNERRVELFGGTQMAVIGNERVRTENNCVPRDILSVGGHLLFGYNVFLGLKTETKVDDVLSLKTFRENGQGFEFDDVTPGSGPDFLEDARFVADYGELYRYYKNARLSALHRVGDRFLAVFQVGQKISDVKAFRWSVGVDGAVTYLDNQGERDHVFPPSHDFEWTPTGRDDHVTGEHPHVNILDEVFVETVGGDLTVKVEDNTATGAGIYAESVAEADQSLDDARVEYARLGSLILIRALPYREEQWRYLVFNTLTRTVARIDNIGQACVQLPEDHGIIFPGGYYLQRGETKTYDADIDGMVFERMIRSPNGEDVLYVFSRPRDGRKVLLPYNLIRKEVQTPIHCNGVCLFEDGKMIVFRVEGDEPTRVHPMQVWQTPFTSDVYADRQPTGDTFLHKIGNADLVRGISDCLSIRRMTEEQSPTREMYEELIAAATRVIDGFHWLEHAEVGDLLTPLREVRRNAELIVDEFVKVQALKAQAQEAVAEAREELAELVIQLTPPLWKRIDEFVEGLSALRRQRGRLITLHDVRYVDVASLDAMEAEVVERFDGISAQAVEFLIQPKALAPYRNGISAIEERIDALEKVADTRPVEEALAKTGEGLALLTEVVGGLAIDDATVRTHILEGISEVLAALNRTRALLHARRQELLGREGVAEFAAQFTLFSQSVTSALALADTPEKCDEALSRLMLTLEELEGRFGEFDEFVERLGTKREEVYEAVNSKKQSLLDRRQRRASNLLSAADRILSGVQRRASTFSTTDDLNAYFASDAMILKLREIVVNLRELDDSVKSDELESRLKAAREDAVRALRDRQEIFEEGESVIRLGRHRFSVNTQPLDLTIAPYHGGMALHLTGTDFHEALDDPEFEDTRRFWDQELVSETRDVYRGEYLAYSALSQAEDETDGLSVSRLNEAALDDQGLLSLLREIAATRYDEGYERGVHDADAAAILHGVLTLYNTAGLLRFAPGPRGAASLFWRRWGDGAARDRLARESASLARLRTAFRHSQAIDALQTRLAEAMRAFYEEHGVDFPEGTYRIGGRYLFEQLAHDPEHFVVSGEAVDLLDGFREALTSSGAEHALDEDLRRLGDDVERAYNLAKAWLTAWVDADASREHFRPALTESAALLVTGDRAEREVSSALGSTQVEDLLGQHPRIRDRGLTIRLDEFLGRVSSFALREVPAYRVYQKRRHELLARQRDRLRLDEFKPRVMSSFVRNKLINDVYLPVFGDNLAKQLGALGAGRRTDLMGMLLLISPPGYGKTTLMEYLANRLGLVFMKINGPALGHSVTSLDPAEAPNATARQEVEKVNLAFEMGNNVLLYLDDIQHTHPEFLQKFISLCDAQRKIEGVWQGRSRTYDLRGKKFAVCMAGNPYTESGATFSIPDMLANRADVYNLGDILGGREDLFELSYIENSLTSNPTLAQITTHEHNDIYKLVRMARGEEIPASELVHPYSQVELEDILAVLRKVLRVQQVLLGVNTTYIASASMDDDYRTEPPFKLQGSYRNMNKLAEKIVPVTNDTELEQLLVDHYIGEAQTLTTGAEHNLLKFGDLRGRMTPEERKRWNEILETFRRQQLLGGDDDDPVTRVTGQLVQISEHVKGIGTQIRESANDRREASVGEELSGALAPYLDQLQATMAENGAAEGEQQSVGGGDEIGRGVGAALAPYLERLEQVLERVSVQRQAGAPAAAETDESSIDVNMILARQVQVIEVGLLPVLESLNSNLAISKVIWKRLNAVLKGLRELQGETPDDEDDPG